MMNVTKCPACLNDNLDPEETSNALSRYVRAYICNYCGTREAFEGFFWRGMAIYAGLLDTEIMSKSISELGV